MPAVRRLAALLALAAAALPAAAQPPDLKRVLVLVAAEVTDPGLARYVRMDVKNFRELLADHLPPDVVSVTELTGPELTATNVLTHYKNLKVGPTDTVVFYYSGHGSYRGDGDPATPGDIHTLEFQYDPAKPGAAGLSKEAMKRRELKAAMLAKGAGLTVILTDCCSTFVEVPPPPDHKPRGKTKAARADATPLGRALFLAARGTVDMTAATEGQVALSDSAVGSYFTAALERVADKRRDQATDWRAFAAALRAETQRVYVEEAKKPGMEELAKQVRTKNVQRPQTFELPGAGGGAGGPGTRYAVIALTNPADKPVKLQIRWGATADWSKPFTMPAGDAQYLAVPQPAGKPLELLFQVKVNGGEPKALQARLVTKDTKPAGREGNVYSLPDCAPAK